jgi:hypothetical protein
MAEQAHSSTETGELGDKQKMQEMMLEFVKEFKKEFQELGEKLERNKIDTKQEFQKMREQFQNTEKNLINRMDKQIEKCEQISGDFSNKNKIEQEKESATVTEQTNEKVTPTETKVTKSKKHRIRKVRVLNSCGINITQFWKQVRKTKLGRVKTLRERKSKCNKVKSNKMFRTNPNKNKTKAFQFRHENVNRQQGSGFTKTNTCVQLTRRQGERTSPNRNNWDTNSNFQSEHLHEKCINCVKLKFQGEHSNERLKKESIVKGKTKHKLRVGNPNNECSNGQRLQHLFQKGIKLTKSSNKVGTNWHELDNGRATNRKIPFKMKRKVVVKRKKMRVRMKEITNRNRFGKPKWKIKLEI